jgi:hypothetical protein
LPSSTFASKPHDIPKIALIIVLLLVLNTPTPTRRAIAQAATFRIHVKQCTGGEDVVREAGFDAQRVQLGADGRAVSGGGGTESGAEGERVRCEAPCVQGPKEAPCVVHACVDVHCEERVLGYRIGAGDLVEHAARDREAEAGVGRGGGRVRGEEPVPGHG